MSYVGDAIVGENVNIGAGTITCNYDGESKHQTIIEDNVFIGSDSMLVAPLKVGKGATTAAGSTITKDVEAGRQALDLFTFNGPDHPDLRAHAAAIGDGIRPVL